ncbi:MAG: hypothetical protein C0391_01400 [Anaerolinea sp.]|nr:hypothetical protein [Anaerolinea sp.]
MNKLRFFTLTVILFVLFAFTTQAYTNPLNRINPKNTHTPQKTPGARATENAIERAERLKGKPEHYKGTILAVDANSITLDAGGNSITAILNADTRIAVPGKPGGELQAGQTAVLKGRRDESDNLVASAVQVIPGKPQRGHFVGTVTAYAPGTSITIQPRKGEAITFQITGDIKILPEKRAEFLTVGSFVTIIAPRDVSGGILTAVGIVIHPADSNGGEAEALTPTP